MTRNTDRLEMLARDLASRYGDDDRMVCEVRPQPFTKLDSVANREHVWRPSPKHAFKNARLVKMGICSAA